MVNYWLRSNKIKLKRDLETSFKLVGGKLTDNYSVGDRFVLYVTCPQGKFLTGVYMVHEDRIAKAIVYLPAAKWFERPSVEDWKDLIGQSVIENSSFDINNNSSWVGRVASEGLRLTREVNCTPLSRQKIVDLKVENLLI